MKASTLLCGAAITLMSFTPAVVADSADPIEDLITKMGHVHLPANLTDIDSTYATEYAKSVAKIIGPGLVIAILSIIIGIIYGMIKLCCFCCCRKNYEDYEHPVYDFWSRMVPCFFYILFLCWIIAGCALGWANNGKFTTGVGDMSTAVIDTGDDAVSLGRTLVGSLENISTAIPEALENITSQISGVYGIADRVDTLGRNVNSTASQVAHIKQQLQAITFQNLTIVKNLNSSLDSISQQSDAVISHVTEMTTEISSELVSVYNDTIENLDSRLSEVTDDVNDITSSVAGFVNQATTMVDDIDTYVKIVVDYDSKRKIVLDVIYAAVLSTTAFAILGLFMKGPIPFKVTAAWSFIFSFLFWAFASIHLLVGIVTSDICPVAHIAVESFIPTDGGTAASAVRGCLNDVSLFDSLGVTGSFNLSQVYDYTNEFDSFTDFVNDFNFTEIGDYLDSVHSLYAYNLTAAADNLTVADFGWSQQYVYDGLDALNEETEPYGYGYSLQNYTQLDLNNFPSNERDQINQTKVHLDELVVANQTIYTELNQTKYELYAVQASISTLTGDMDDYSADFDTVHSDIQELATTNVTRAIAAIKQMIDVIDNFFTLGDCSFVGTNLNALINGFCVVLRPAVDLLAGSQYMIGMGLIAVIVLVEVLAVRWPWPSYDGVDYYDGKEEKYDYNDPPARSGEPQSISLGVRSADQPPPDYSS